ncbi:hypothetical protein CHLNCDRAFT_26299, partial [Chlorella variabilis]
MDIVATQTQLTWRAIGGMVDLFVFMGPSPLEVLEQLTRVVGRPAMQPYWAFGFHQSKYGYSSLAQVQGVVANYSAAGIPLEAIWLDIDYSECPRFAADLAAQGQKVVPIVGPGIKIDPTYDVYLDGLQQNVYLKSSDSCQPYVGWVWPGGVHFPDFGWNPDANTFWTEQLQKFSEAFNYSGIWTDMQEISAAGCRILNMPHPPLPALQAVGVLAQHLSGTVEYDAHNLYGLTMAQATAAALEKIKRQRAFLSAWYPRRRRSTYPGSGAYAAHWTGDNNSSWPNLQWSITGVIASGLAGIPMAGADICGFSGNVTTQLCARWMEVGAFYPFARNN